MEHMAQVSPKRLSLAFWLRPSAVFWLLWPPALLAQAFALVLYLGLVAPSINPRQIGQLDLVAPDGTARTLELWERRPIIPLPYNDRPEFFVRYTGREGQITGRAFGSGLGDVVISPDGRLAVATARFKGAQDSGVVVNLETSEMIRAEDLPTGGIRIAGWDRRRWKFTDD